MARQSLWTFPIGSSIDSSCIETMRLGLEFANNFRKRVIKALQKVTQNQPLHILPQKKCTDVFAALSEACVRPLASAHVTFSFLVVMALVEMHLDRCLGLASSSRNSAARQKYPSKA